MQLVDFADLVLACDQVELLDCLQYCLVKAVHFCVILPCDGHFLGKLYAKSCLKQRVKLAHILVYQFRLDLLAQCVNDQLHFFVSHLIDVHH